MTEFAEALGNSLLGMAPPPVRRHRSLSLWAKIACGFIFVAGLAAIVFYFWGPSLTSLVANRSSSGSPKQLIGKDAASTLLAQALAEGRYGRFTEVVRLTTEAMQADPDNAAIHEVRGRAYNELSEYDKAILDFTDALSKDPTFVLAYVSRSQAHLSLRHYQESIDDANAGLKLNPVELRARVSLCANRGWALACMGKYDNALLDYEQVVKLDSRNALGYWQRAVIFDHANRPTEAQQDRTKAIDLDPSLKNSPPPKLE
jgi:tetratricopeptide (TPR) repeat protein